MADRPARRVSWLCIAGTAWQWTNKVTGLGPLCVGAQGWIAVGLVLLWLVWESRPKAATEPPGLKPGRDVGRGRALGRLIAHVRRF